MNENEFYYNPSSLNSAIDCLKNVCSNMELINDSSISRFSDDELDHFTSSSNNLAACTASLTGISSFLSNISDVVIRIKEICDKTLYDDSVIALEISKDEWIKKKQEYYMNELKMTGVQALLKASFDYELLSNVTDVNTIDSVVSNFYGAVKLLINIDESDINAINMINAYIGTSYILMKGTYSDFLSSDTDLSYSEFYNNKLDNIGGTGSYNMSLSDRRFLESFGDILTNQKPDISNVRLSNYYDKVMSNETLYYKDKTYLDSYLSDNKEVNKIVDSYIDTIKEQTGEDIDKSNIVYYKNDESEILVHNGNNIVIEEKFTNKEPSYIEVTGKNGAIIDENLVAVPRVTINFDEETGKKEVTNTTFLYNSNNELIARIDDELSDESVMGAPSADEYVKMFSLENHSQHTNSTTFDTLFADASEKTKNFYLESSSVNINQTRAQANGGIIEENLNRNGCGYYSFSACLKHLGIDYNALDVARYSAEKGIIYNANENYKDRITDTFCKQYGLSYVVGVSDDTVKELLDRGYSCYTTVSEPGGRGDHYVSVVSSGKTNSNGENTYYVVNSYIKGNYPNLSNKDIVNEFTADELFNTIESNYELIGTSDASDIIENTSYSTYVPFNEELYNNAINTGGDLANDIMETSKSPKETVTVLNKSYSDVLNSLNIKSVKLTANEVNDNLVFV